MTAFNAVDEIEQGDIADELREDMGSTRDILDRYDPSSSVTRYRRYWVYTTSDGNACPSFFKTKHEALAASQAHLKLKEEQYRTPSRFSDIFRVRARKSLALGQQYMNHGMSELEAFAQVALEHPEWDDRPPFTL